MTNDEICAAIKDVFDDTRSVMEPAGALAVAGLKAWVERARARAGERLVAVLSGANMNFDRLRFVAERAELGEAREALLGGDDSRAAGRLPRVLRRDRAARRHRVQLPAERPRAPRTSSWASRPRRARTAARLAAALRERGYATLDLTDNEMAKLHVRYMVGGARRGARTSGSTASSSRSGRARSCSSSRRSAGAGTSACSTTATTAPTSAACWPPSRCPTPSSASSRRFLDRLGYPSVAEGDNPAYALFLAGNGS